MGLHFCFAGALWLGELARIVSHSIFMHLCIVIGLYTINCSTFDVWLWMHGMFVKQSVPYTATKWCIIKTRNTHKTLCVNICGILTSLYKRNFNVFRGLDLTRIIRFYTNLYSLCECKVHKKGYQILRNYKIHKSNKKKILRFYLLLKLLPM